MGFEDRARKWCARKDFVRATIVLVEGLKRYPERAESLELLLRIYTEECDNPGLERDILGALVRQSDCGSLVGQVCVRLEEQDKIAMKRAMIQQMRERRLEIIWPPPPVEPEPVEQVVDETQHVDSIDGDLDVNLGQGLVETTSSGSVDQQVGDPAFEIREDHGDPSMIQASHEATTVPRVLADIDAEVEDIKKDVIRADSSPEQGLGIHNKNVTALQNRRERSDVRKNKSGDKKTSTAKTSRVTAIIVGLVLFVVIVGIGLYYWDDMRVNSQLTRLDSMLSHFDPEHFQAFEDALQETMSSTVGESRALIERRQFANAVRAIESHRVVESKPADDPVSDWGAGALILWAIAHDDIEKARIETVKLEFTYPDSLSTLWVRARLIEHIGDYAESQKLYEEAAQRYPNYVPTYLGLARLAARRFDVKGWDQALSQLHKVSTKHSYHQLVLDTRFEDVLLAVPTQQNEQASEERAQAAAAAINNGNFYAAMRKFNLAVDALANGDIGSAQVLIHEASNHDPELRIASVLHAVLDALDLNIVGSTEYVVRAIAIDTDKRPTSLELRLLTQYIAPLALTAAGRPDMGMRFTTPIENSAAQNIEANIHEPAPIDTLIKELEMFRPVTLDFQAKDYFDTHPIARKALLARAQTLNALGASAYARDTLSELPEDASDASAVAFQRFVASVVSNQHQDALRQIASMAEGSGERHTAQAIVAHLEARFSDAIEHANAGYAARPDSIDALRPLVLSLIEAGKGREAVTVLESARVGPVWGVGEASLRTRVYARMGMREMIDARVLEEISDDGVAQDPFATVQHIDQQIDRLAAALWLRQNKSARDLIAGMAIEPDHPEWKWTAGLYYRGIGEQNLAAAQFKKSWRKDQNRPELLVELGSVHLEFERYELAQEAFYAAIRRDRGNIQALRGISETYLAYDLPSGRRHLVRMLENLGNSPHYGPQRAELRKWLAVLYGLREGASEALPYIEKAQQEVGDRADLLIELARYHEARQEFAIARIHYANALQKNSTLPDAHYGLAQMAIHAGDYRVARDHLKRFLALTPPGQIQSEAQEQLAQIQNKSAQ